MSDLTFVDTNLLVYARDAGVPDKQGKAATWMAHLWANGTGRISHQVLHEFYVTVTRKLKPGLDATVARDEVRSLLAWDPLPMHESVIEEAWRLEDRFALSWWDALIVAAAQVADCRWLLSENLQAGQQFGRVQVMNPFVAVPG